MCYTLLHAQDAFRTVWKYKPQWINCQSLKELENVMWGFGDRLSHQFLEFPVIPALPISPSLPVGTMPGPVPGSVIPIPPGGVQEFPADAYGVVPNFSYDPSQSPVPVPGFYLPAVPNANPSDFGTVIHPSESPVPVPLTNTIGLIMTNPSESPVPVPLTNTIGLDVSGLGITNHSESPVPVPILNNSGLVMTNLEPSDSPVPPSADSVGILFSAVVSESSPSDRNPESTESPVPVPTSTKPNPEATDSPVPSSTNPTDAPVTN